MRFRCIVNWSFDIDGDCMPGMRRQCNQSHRWYCCSRGLACQQARLAVLYVLFHVPPYSWPPHGLAKPLAHSVNTRMTFVRKLQHARANRDRYDGLLATIDNACARADVRCYVKVRKQQRVVRPFVGPSGLNTQKYTLQNIVSFGINCEFSRSDCM